MTTYTQESQPNPQLTIALLQNELAATNHEVMLLTLELEQRVAERTSQLSNANKALQKEVRERRQAEDEVRKLNADLEKRAAELQAVNQDLEAFSYSVSHDLRGPLRHINGYATLVRDEYGQASPEEVEDYIQAILNRTKKMNQLIDDLIQFSRMSRAQVQSSHVQFRKLVDVVLADLRPEIESRQVEWNIHDLPDVHGDPNLIRHVLTNLIGNALKYSRNEEAAKIEIGYRGAEDGYKIFFVKDNGVGFDPRYTDRLFGVFERLHSEREFEGTGIGLANVRRIVERHGGRTWAEGAVGEGATFYFTLPNGLD